MLSESKIASNWLRLSEQVSQTAIDSGRNPEDITIIAVSKKQPLQAIQFAYNAGARVFGENYAQEFREKTHEAESLQFFPEWHFIGSLQSNKAKYIVPKAQLIHSCSSLSLAEELQKLALKHNVDVSVLVQINTSGESSKSGIQPEQARDFIGKLLDFSQLHVRGLMTLPTASEEENIVRGEFALLKKMQEKLLNSHERLKDFTVLSMGMSGDFPWAIQEGATHIRVGTAIFGERT